jgi:FkbM family methyltransferase
MNRNKVVLSENILIIEKIRKQIQIFLNHPRMALAFIKRDQMATNRLRREFLKTEGIKISDESLNPHHGIGGLIQEIILEDHYGLKTLSKKRIVHPIVLDIGANVGLFAIWCLHLMPDAEVYCYEPEPFTFQELESNLSLNGLHAVANQKVCANEEREYKLYLGLGTGTNTIINELGQTDEFIPVEGTTLDKIFEENQLSSVYLLKLDVEGAEASILESAHVLGHILNIVIEYHTEQIRNKVIRILIANGFQVSARSSLKINWLGPIPRVRELKEGGMIYATRLNKLR